MWSHDLTIGTLRSNDATATKTSLKSKFAFLQSLSRLFLPTYFVKCRQTLLKLNSRGPYPSSEREIKFRCCFFTFSIKRKIRHFHVVVAQKRQKNAQKKCDARAKLLFFLLKLLFFIVLVEVGLLDLKILHMFICFIFWGQVWLRRS